MVESFRNSKKLNVAGSWNVYMAGVGEGGEEKGM